MKWGGGGVGGLGKILLMKVFMFKSSSLIIIIGMFVVKLQFMLFFSKLVFLYKILDGELNHGSIKKNYKNANLKMSPAAQERPSRVVIIFIYLFIYYFFSIPLLPPFSPLLGQFLLMILYQNWAALAAEFGLFDE